jgi:hypothetical protein
MGVFGRFGVLFPKIGKNNNGTKRESRNQTVCFNGTRSVSFGARAKVPAYAAERNISLRLHRDLPGGGQDFSVAGTLPRNDKGSMGPSSTGFLKVSGG